jgi:GTPase SAR1 family protein
VYDVTAVDSLASLKRWRDEVLRAAPGQGLVVVGNKVDLERVVRPALARAAAACLGASYLETSALSGEGVEDLFRALAALAVRGRPAFRA